MQIRLIPLDEGKLIVFSGGQLRQDFSFRQVAGLLIYITITYP